VCYLYVYPTLLARLEDVIRRMLVDEEFKLKKVVTVEYHFENFACTEEVGLLRVYEASGALGATASLA